MTDHFFSLEVEVDLCPLCPFKALQRVSHTITQDNFKPVWYESGLNVTASPCTSWVRCETNLPGGHFYQRTSDGSRFSDAEQSVSGNKLNFKHDKPNCAGVFQRNVCFHSCWKSECYVPGFMLVCDWRENKLWNVSSRTWCNKKQTLTSHGWRESISDDRRLFSWTKQQKKRRHNTDINMFCKYSVKLASDYGYVKQGKAGIWNIFIRIFVSVLFTANVFRVKSVYLPSVDKFSGIRREEHIEYHEKQAQQSIKYGMKCITSQIIHQVRDYNFFFLL